VHNVSQWHLGESLGGAEGLLEAVSFKKATKGMSRGRVAMRVVFCTVGDLSFGLSLSL